MKLYIELDVDASGIAVAGSIHALITELIKVKHKLQLFGDVAEIPAVKIIRDPTKATDSNPEGEIVGEWAVS